MATANAAGLSEVDGDGVPYDSIREIDEIREKKQKPVISHEVGFGAPCNKCGDKCPGFDLHFWRKICKNCRCQPYDHDIKSSDRETARKIGRLFDDEEHQEKYSSFKKFTLVMPDVEASPSSPEIDFTFEWIPHNVSNNVAIKYMQSMPLEQQPIVGSAGAIERTRRLNEQLPSHDQDPQFCDQLTPVEADLLVEYVKQYKSQAIGIGQVDENVTGSKWVCYKCHSTMLSGDVAVFANKAGPHVCWHPRCFTCRTCNDILVDLIYFWSKDDSGKYDVYCGRHYGNLHKPRCTACDELIFAQQYTHAEDCDWHLKHFCCWQCDIALGGRQYVAKSNHPFCLNCYEMLFAKMCSTCNNVIAANDPRVSHKNNYWHKAPGCFRCSHCHNSLINKQFIPKQDQPFVFCSKKCRSALFPRQSISSVLD